MHLRLGGRYKAFWPGDLHLAHLVLRGQPPRLSEPVPSRSAVLELRGMKDTAIAACCCLEVHARGGLLRSPWWGCWNVAVLRYTRCSCPALGGSERSERERRNRKERGFVCSIRAHGPHCTLMAEWSVATLRRATAQHANARQKNGWEMRAPEGLVPFDPSFASTQRAPAPLH